MNNEDIAHGSSSNASDLHHSDQDDCNFRNIQPQQRTGSDRSNNISISSLPVSHVNQSYIVPPIDLLSLYSAGLLRRRSQTTKTSHIDFQQLCHSQQLDEPLRVIDFLFNDDAQVGHQPASSSIVEGAIQILDQYFLNHASMNTEIDSISRMTTNSIHKKRRYTNVIDTLSQMKSPAGRSLYLVAKGSKSEKKRCHGDTSTTKHDSSSHYLCLLSDEIPKSDAYLINTLPPMLYCSCHMFLERNRTLQAHETANRDRSVALCKHLLAIKLLPVFGAAFGISPEESSTEFSIPTMEFASEEDYGRAIVQRLTN